MHVQANRIECGPRQVAALTQSASTAHNAVSTVQTNDSSHVYLLRASIDKLEVKLKWAHQPIHIPCTHMLTSEHHYRHKQDVDIPFDQSKSGVSVGIPQPTRLGSIPSFSSDTAYNSTSREPRASKHALHTSLNLRAVPSHPVSCVQHIVPKQPAWTCDTV